MLFVAVKTGDPEPLFRQIEFLCEEFVEPRQLLLLEIISQTPIPQHFKKCRVAIVTDFLDVLCAE